MAASGAAADPLRRVLSARNRIGRSPKSVVRSKDYGLRTTDYWTMATRKEFWRYVRGLAAPVLLWSLFVTVLIEPLQTWLNGDETYDKAVLREWIEEARVFRETLPTV